MDPFQTILFEEVYPNHPQMPLTISLFLLSTYVSNLHHLSFVATYFITVLISLPGHTVFSLIQNALQKQGSFPRYLLPEVTDFSL